MPDYIEPNYRECDACEACAALDDLCDFHRGFVEGVTAQAEAVRARVLDEEPYDVIAARMRCSELVARKRVSRGLATLRDVLEER